MTSYKYSFFVILNALLVSSDTEVPSSSDGIQFRQVYGPQASTKIPPYYASFSNCAAAIISQRWLVTSAQCIKSDNNTIPIWVGGESQQNSLVYSDKVIVHPQFTTVGLAILNDIALLRLSQPLEFNERIQSVNIPLGDFYTKRHTLVVTTNIMQSGENEWLVMEANATRLTKVDCYQVLTPSKLSKLASYWPEMMDALICAQCYSKYCPYYYYDSGSSLVNDNTLIGIASIMPASSGEHVIFHVRVAAYAQWIKCTVLQNKND